MNPTTTPIQDVTADLGEEPDATLVPELGGGIIDTSPGSTAYLQYVPLIERIMRAHGDLELPRLVIARQAALAIQNAYGESVVGHEYDVGSMVSEWVEGVNRWGQRERIVKGTRDLLVTAGDFHDLGKTGPPPSINPDPLPFVKFYLILFPSGSSTTLLRDDLDQAVASGELSAYDRDYIKKTLRAYGRDPDKMTRRDMFDTHSPSTYDIMTEAGAPDIVAKAAAGHHLKKEVRINGYPMEELAETGQWLEPADSWSAINRAGRKDNKGRTRPHTTDDMVRAVYGSFEAMKNRDVSATYCSNIQSGVASGVLAEVLGRHQRITF